MVDSGVPSNGDNGTRRLGPVPRVQESALLAALGDEQTRAILLFLHEAPRSVQEIVERCAVPQASVYRKLRELQEGGLVGIQRSALSADGHRTDLFRSRLGGLSVRLAAGRLDVAAEFRDLAAERLTDMWDQVRGARKR